MGISTIGRTICVNIGSTDYGDKRVFHYFDLQVKKSALYYVQYDKLMSESSKNKGMYIESRCVVGMRLHELFRMDLRGQPEIEKE
jgi:hypothetical protein